MGCVENKKRVAFITGGGGYLGSGVADLAVLDDTDEGFDLTDKAGNHIESPKGYRCVLTVLDGQVVYRN